MTRDEILQKSALITSTRNTMDLHLVFPGSIVLLIPTERKNPNKYSIAYIFGLECEGNMYLWWRMDER